MIFGDVLFNSTGTNLVGTEVALLGAGERPGEALGQCTAIRPPVGISSSGQRSCRCQRRSLISRVRVATRRSR